MRIYTIFRLVVAVVFALIAFIFSEVVPDIKPFDKTILRVALTTWFGLLGYALFPSLALLLTSTIATFINVFTNKISTEIMDKILRLPSNQSISSVPYPHNAQVGGVSVNQPLILDTSAIIDGRVLDIAKTNFLFGTLLIPQFVLSELQQVADSADFIKRSRGRRGFEVISDMKKIKGLRIDIWDKDQMAKTVDESLIKLAKSLHGRILTTDFNLNKVATLSGVTVLNINDLANAVKTIAVPGENLKVKVLHLGKDPKQGVGYLADGTMIVVENGAQLVGQEINTEVLRVMQVSAGRMVFVKTN